MIKFVIFRALVAVIGIVDILINIALIIVVIFIIVIVIIVTIIVVVTVVIIIIVAIIVCFVISSNIPLSSSSSYYSPPPAPPPGQCVCVVGGIKADQNPPQHLLISPYQRQHAALKGLCGRAWCSRGSTGSG
jgi:hypothetical protein